MNVQALAKLQWEADESRLRSELLAAFSENRDTQRVTLWKPGERWRSDWGFVHFPDQQRIYL